MKATVHIIFVNSFYIQIEYSWLLMYKKNCIVQKQYIVAVLDQLNLKVEINKRSLGKKLENLAEVDVKFF